MKIEKLLIIINEIREKMNLGKLKEALRMTYELKKQSNDYETSFCVSGLLIDIGSAMLNEKIVKEGVNLLKKNFKAIIRKKKYAQRAYYNLANGLSELYKFKKRKNRFAACFNKTELNEAKRFFRKSIDYGFQEKSLLSKIYVNFGNCFNNLGRIIDALDCYDKALMYESNHGMVLGNKGVALFHFAWFIGEHESTYLIDSYNLITKAIKVGVHPESEEYFKWYLNKIREIFPDKKKLDNPPKYLACKIKTKNKFEKFLIKFCLDNKLYLNPCNYCKKCNEAIGDPIVINRMIIDRKENKGLKSPTKDPFLSLSSFLNQIKQDYVSARFLMVLSQYRNLNLNFVDKKVRLIDTLDYSLHNIRIQLLKMSFKNLYNILDKIAFFIKDYLRLNIKDKRKIKFHTIWYSDIQKRKIYELLYKLKFFAKNYLKLFFTAKKKAIFHKHGKPRYRKRIIREEIQLLQNYSLNALFDIHKDFMYGPYKDLITIRNAMTHRFVNIKMYLGKENPENISYDILLKQTLRLARIIRNCIIYLAFFVSNEERKKERKLRGFSMPLFAREIPDDLKNF